MTHRIALSISLSRSLSRALSLFPTPSAASHFLREIFSRTSFFGLKMPSPARAPLIPGPRSSLVSNTSPP